MTTNKLVNLFKNHIPNLNTAPIAQFSHSLKAHALAFMTTKQTLTSDWTEARSDRQRDCDGAEKKKKCFQDRYLLHGQALSHT